MFPKKPSATVWPLACEYVERWVMCGQRKIGNCGVSTWKGIGTTGPNLPLCFLAGRPWAAALRQHPTLTLCLRRALRTMEPNGPWAESSENRSLGKPSPLSHYQLGCFVTVMRSWHSPLNLHHVVYLCYYSSAIFRLRLIHCWLKRRIPRTESSKLPLLRWQLETVKMIATLSQEALTVSLQRIVGGKRSAACGNMRVASCSHSVKMDVPVNYAVITTHRQSKYQGCCTIRPHRKPMLACLMPSLRLRSSKVKSQDGWHHWPSLHILARPWCFPVGFLGVWKSHLNSTSSLHLRREACNSWSGRGN